MFDTSKYFKHNKTRNNVSFIGNELIIYVPKRYASYGYLQEGTEIETIGVFDMEVDGIKCVYNVQTLVTIIPSESESVNIDGRDFLKLTLKKNDVFLKSALSIKNANIPYIIFYEFILLGKYPMYMGYDDMASLFDNAKEVSGLSLNSDHSILELYVSQLARNPDKISQLYRNSGIKGKPTMLALRDIAHSATTLTGKIGGSFMQAGIVSALIDDDPSTSDVETVLRK